MRALLAGALLAAAPSLAAEPLYVIEQLVVGVSSTPDEAAERIATVRSGDRVEVLERLDDQARVRLGNGTEGWVKIAYLSAEVPLRRQLAERARDLESVRTELSRTERELADARADAARARSPVTAPDPAAAVLVAAERPLFPARAASGPRPTWAWVAVACALALAAGFAIGWRVLDRRIRRKYGGLRIY